MMNEGPSKVYDERKRRDTRYGKRGSVQSVTGRKRRLDEVIYFPLVVPANKLSYNPPALTSFLSCIIYTIPVLVP